MSEGAGTDTAKCAQRGAQTDSASLSDWFRDTPESRRMLDEARARFARSVSRLCPFGNCTVDIDPLDGTIVGAAGPVGCGCDSLPGWRSQRWDGLPKPGWAGKAVGRHGGRIAASRRKHAEHARWIAESGL